MVFHVVAILGLVFLVHADPRSAPGSLVEVTFVPAQEPAPAAAALPGPTPGNPEHAQSGGPVAEAPKAAPRPRPWHRSAPPAAQPGVAVAVRQAAGESTTQAEPRPQVESAGAPDAGAGVGAGGSGRGASVGSGSGDGGRGGVGGGAATPPVALGDYDSMQLPYTRRAIDAGIGGNVVLDMVIDKNGDVVAMYFVRRLGYGLDEIAAGVAAKFRFRPARDALGVPTEGHVLWQLRFRPPQ